MNTVIIIIVIATCAVFFAATISDMGCGCGAGRAGMVLLDPCWIGVAGVVVAKPS